MVVSPEPSRWAYPIPTGRKAEDERGFRFELAVLASPQTSPRTLVSS